MAMITLVSVSGAPGVSSTALALASSWAKHRLKRPVYADSEHPFRLQGSADLNSYKMFAEVFWNLMRPDGSVGVILPTVAFNVPVTIFIMRAFFATLPRELFDAARVDGAGEWRIFWRIAMPIARPAMFTAGIVNMIWVWNDFLFPMVFINNPARKTLPVGLTDFVGEHITNYPVMLAAILIAAIAPLVLFVIFERQVTAALLGGAVKE